MVEAQVVVLCAVVVLNLHRVGAYTGRSHNETPVWAEGLNLLAILFASGFCDALLK